MEEHTRKFKHIRCRKASVPYSEKSGKNRPRKSHITKAEIDFCVNCEKKSCNGSRCAELKKFLREVNNE